MRKAEDKTNLLGEYSVDYITWENTEDGEKLVIIHADDNGETRDREDLPKFASMAQARDHLSGTYYPSSFDTEIDMLLEYGTINWDTVNNAIFIGDPDGVYSTVRNEYLNAREVGREAVSDYEVTLVEAVLSTINTLKHIVKG